MKLRNHSLIYIKRNLGKSLVLLCLISAMGMLVSATISMNQAFSRTENNLRNRTPAIFSFIADRGWFWSWSASERNYLVNETLPLITELPYVSMYDISQQRAMFSLYLRRYLARYNDTLVFIPPGMGFASFILRGFSSTDIIYFDAGQLELVSGRSFVQEEMEVDDKEQSFAAIVSLPFALYNDVWEGDTILLSSLLAVSTKPIDDHERVAGYQTVDFKFEIIGIWNYVNRLTEFQGSRELAFLGHEDHLNSIFVPNWVLQNIVTTTRDFDTQVSEISNSFVISIPYNTTNAYFILSDPRYTEDFRLAASEILPTGVYLDDYSIRFAAVQGSMAQVLEITNFAMWSSIMIGIFFLFLVVVLFLYDRRHEVGIYVALGARKSKIILKFVIEIFILAFTGITVALFVGNFISNQLSEVLLVQEMTDFHSDITGHGMTLTDIEIRFGFHEITPHDMLEATDIGFELSFIIVFYLIGLIVTMLATTLPIMYLLKQAPKKVLLS